jgi:hypothetical protein
MHCGVWQDYLIRPLHSKLFNLGANVVVKISKNVSGGTYPLTLVEDAQHFPKSPVEGLDLHARWRRGW